MLIGIDASRATRPQRTGTENYTLYLTRALVKLGPQHRFRLYLDHMPPAGLLPHDERVEWRVMPFPRLWTHVRLAWEVARHPPDVLFVPAHVLPLVHPRRSVATVHDLGYLRHPAAHTLAGRWYLAWATRFNARTAARVIVDSQATRSDLEQLYQVAPEKLVVAYPAGTEGFAPVSDPAARADVQARYGAGASYFLYVGTLQPRKNLLALIEAYARLRAAGHLGPDVRLVLAGKAGWLAEGIIARARAADVRDAVALPGYVAERDLPALLSGALAFVMPSWYEGFGLPVLEAMACGAPVIASDVSSLPEVAGGAALLVDPRNVDALAEAMLRAYRDPALRAELAARGLERARHFTWEACARTVLAALEQVGAGAADGR
ncbi:MAG: glycosyltransferase family 1 protein [Chloroflexota bacterium]